MTSVDKKLCENQDTQIMQAREAYNEQVIIKLRSNRLTGISTENPYR